MKEIFLDVICAVLFEKPLSSVNKDVKRKHRRQGESAMRSELANINMQIIHSRTICR